MGAACLWPTLGCLAAVVVATATATATARADSMRWVDGADYRLREMDLRTREVRVFEPELPAVGKMALAGGRLYWGNTGNFFSANVDGTDLRPVADVPGDVWIEALGGAVDRAAGVWYWHDLNQGQPSSISSGRLGEREGSTLFSTGTQFVAEDETDLGIAFDPVDRKIYWAGWRGAEGGLIRRADVDGTDAETVFEAADLNFTGRRVHLELDPVHRMLYWVHANRIVRAPLDGGGTPEVVFEGGFPVGLTLDITVPEPGVGWVLLPALALGRRRR